MKKSDITQRHTDIRLEFCTVLLLWSWTKTDVHQSVGTEENLTFYLKATKRYCITDQTYRQTGVTKIITMPLRGWQQYKLWKHDTGRTKCRDHSII